MDKFSQDQKQYLIGGVVVLLGLATGLAVGGIDTDGPEPLPEEEQPSNTSEADDEVQGLQPAGLEYERISSDSRFQTISTINANPYNIDNRIKFHNWTFGNESVGDWRLKGLGGKPKPSKIRGIDNTSMYLHTFTLSPERPSRWLGSNISQSVSIPEDTTRLKAVAVGRNGGDSLYNSSEVPATCEVSQMFINIRIDGSEAIEIEEEVSSSKERLVGIANASSGDTAKVTAGIKASSDRCKNNAWLRLDSVELLATSGQK